MHAEDISAVRKVDSGTYIENVYMVREAIRDLTKFMKRYPVLSRTDREAYFLFAIKKIQVLKANAIPISTEAFMESVQLSVNILGFRECLDEKYRALAEGNIRKIIQIFGLDQQLK